MYAGGFRSGHGLADGEDGRRHMDRVYFRENVLVYYGNPAGYLLEGKVVLDVLFQKEELIQFLMKEHSVEVEAREGVYDSLVEGERAGKKDILTERRIRIHQLRSNAPILLRFVSLEERQEGIWAAMGFRI